MMRSSPWYRTLAILSTAAVLAACPSQEQDRPAAGVAEEEPAAPAPPPVKDLESTSALSFHRGMLERDAFRPCDSQMSFALRDQTGGTLESVRQELPDPKAAIYVEARGERSEQESPSFLLEELLYATPSGEGGGCDRPPPDYQVLARGSEPFWSVEVRESGTAFRQVDEPQEMELGPAEFAANEGSVVYVATAEGHELELLVAGHACRDAMSGEFFAYVARATLDGRKLLGCARVGE